MAFQRAQSQRCGKAWYNLLPAQSLPHNLAQLDDPTGPFTFADLGGVASPRLDEVQVWADFHRPKWFSATHPRRRKGRVLRNPLPDAEGGFMYPIFALIILMLFTWIVAIWASCTESDTLNDGEKPQKRSDEQNHREASLKQNLERSTASPRLQQERPSIVREKTCRHTYVFQTPNGGPYGL